MSGDHNSLPPTRGEGQGQPDRKWWWWAGRNEEFLTIGPSATREAVIADAMDDIGKGEGSFTVLEGRMHELSLSASSILDEAYEQWSDGDQFSAEGDPPEPCGSKEDQAAAQAELQSALDAWVAKWRHTLPTPNMFAATRNEETIENAPSAAGQSLTEASVYGSSPLIDEAHTEESKP